MRSKVDRHADGRALAQKQSEREAQGVTRPWESPSMDTLPSDPLGTVRRWRRRPRRSGVCVARDSLRLAVFLALISALDLPLRAEVCNPTDLQGPYGFQLSGETTISGEPKPVANLGRMVLAADGKISGFSTTMFAGYLLGNVVTGTYEARWDCTMTWSLQDDSGAFQHFSGVATSDGKRVHFIQTDPGGAQAGAMAKTSAECKASDLRKEYAFTLSGSTTPMAPGETSSKVAAKGLIQAGENASFKLAPGDISADPANVTITVDAGCIVEIDLTLPVTGAGAGMPTIWRGVLVDEGREILAIETDPGAMVSATFTAP